MCFRVFLSLCGVMCVCVCVCVCVVCVLCVCCVCVVCVTMKDCVYVHRTWDSRSGTPGGSRGREWGSPRQACGSEIVGFTAGISLLLHVAVTSSSCMQSEIDWVSEILALSAERLLWMGVSCV